MAIIPTPLTNLDRRAGYWWELSVGQVEVSRTIVFDAPRRARAFFESLVADNIGIGRPESVSAVFARQVRRNTPGVFRTRVFTQGVDVKLDITYKRCRVKEYLKQGVALRIETALFERISQPYVREGQRTGALRFGDVRAMALAGTLCMVVHAVAGFTNRSLRALVAGKLGTTYTAVQMTYDLRRLRLHGLIYRLPHTNTYLPTPDGIRVAVFYTKLHDRLLSPLLAADHPPAPQNLRAALRTIDRAVDEYVATARLRPAA